jgi:hypothetical protein
MTRCVKVALISLVFALAGCAGAKTYCSCTGYLPAAPRPQWISGEQFSNGVYQAQGIAACTGVQELDFKAAEEAALQNLGRMLQVHVRNRTYSVQGEYDPGAGYSEGKIQSWSDSDGVLTRSRVFARWVDPEACMVYAGARIAARDIEEARRKTHDQEARRLSNQPFLPVTSRDQREVVEPRLVTWLSQAGVRRIVPRGDGYTYVAEAGIAESRFAEDGRSAQVEMFVHIRDPGGRILWSRQQAGKAVSLKMPGCEVLLKNAVDDALDRLRRDIEEVLRRPINE